MITVKEAWRVIVEWNQRYLYQDPALIEMAEAIQYGGVKIVIVGGKLKEITPYRGVLEQDKATK